MTSELVVEHYKEVNALLTEVGYSTRRRAFLVNKTAQTLKQYSTSPNSSQYRRIASADLDKLRSTALDETWRKQWDLLAQWKAQEGLDGASALPVRYRVEGQSTRAGGVTFLFRPAAQEVADETGARVVCLAPKTEDEIPAGVGEETQRAAQRSRWRKAVFALRKKVNPEDVKPILTEVTGYCEYSVMRIGLEYPAWRIPPQEQWIADLEARAS
ncbi:hypothetical protein [Rhizobium favelukesii]|uniref:hypothetical protein n=2 Tax=Rhizobium TaxID=379 RepID=UPI001146AA4A|nr:hypothetical protein [Rhizobium favelukesii]